MTELEALQILRAHNEWRRSEEWPAPVPNTPREIGEAIDVACGVLAERTCGYFKGQA